MSYIIEQPNPLVLMKLTSDGRKAIAKGELDFKFWTIGDSEVDYRYADNVTDLLREPDTLNILRPKDKQPALKTYPCTLNCQQFFPIQPHEIVVEECCVKNEARNRGFFLGDKVSSLAPNSYTIDPSLAITSGIINSTQLNGGNILNINTSNYTKGDYLLIKITNNTLGNIPADETDFPIPYLFFQIQNDNINSIVELDRLLPNYSMYPNVRLDFYIYPYGDGNSILNYYGNNQISAYWNSETLEFTYPCDITSGDVRVWNFNAVWGEDFAGLQDGYQPFTDFGSMDYIGQMEYLGYNACCDDTTIPDDCQEKLNAVEDKCVRGIGIIHYTNNNPSNEYGEHFHIDNITYFFRVSFPTIMWHRRFQLQPGAILDLGMEFISSGGIKYVENSQIPYYDLVENSSLIDLKDTPMVVGRVFPTLKIATIDHPELLAIVSYKSNRNWSLPKLEGKMILPAAGVNNGLIPVQKELFLTYVLEANDGIQYTVPHQKYIKYINRGNATRDVVFSIEDIRYLKYMFQINVPTYTGLGFYAHKFKILAQLVDIGQRPIPSQWRSIDFTSPLITTNPNFTINPRLLAQTDPLQTGFTLTRTLYDNAPLYDLSVTGIPQICCPFVLNYGDERFLYGNVHTWIGACIYRTKFVFNINGDGYDKTLNPTWETGQPFYMSEIGIYNSKKVLVGICKLSRPIKMVSGRTFRLIISLDF